MQQKMSLGSNRVNWMRSLWKHPTRLRGTNFCINYTSSVCFATSFMQLRNDPKCIQILRNAPKHLFWVQWGGLGAFVAKSSTRLRGMNFCTSSACFAPSFVRQPDGHELTQVVWNAPKCQFWVQWGGPGVFVAKNSEATSWHELLH